MEDRSFFTEEGRHGTDRRPMAVLRCRSGPGTAMPARYLAPRHWHEEVEILYFTQGRFTVELDLQETAFAPGEICLVNAGTLHRVQSEPGASEHLALLFDPRILAFSYADEVQQRLVAPLLAGQTGLCSKVVPGDPAYLPLRGALLALQQLYAAQGPGWYIRAKLQLLELLAALGETGALRPTPQGRLPGEAVARYKAVVSCIRARYMEKLTLAQLARAAGCSPEYLCRFFRKISGSTPVEYLVAFRIEQAKALLRATGDSVLEISLACGFDSPSYFNRQFKRRTGQTPNAYRRQAAGQGNF